MPYFRESNLKLWKVIESFNIYICGKTKIAKGYFSLSKIQEFELKSLIFGNIGHLGRRGSNMHTKFYVTKFTNCPNTRTDGLSHIQETSTPLTHYSNNVRVNVEGRGDLP